MSETLVAVGTGLLALATFVLAAIAAWNVRKTGALVSATEKSAAAAAATVDEIRRDRELAWMPYVVLEPGAFGSNIGPNEMTITGFVTNVGRGPALNCFHAYIGSGKWSRSPLFGIPAGDKRNVASVLTPPPIDGALFTYGQEAIDNIHVVVCQDSFGDKLYRFIGGRAGFDIWRKQEARPAWVGAALHIEPQLEPK